MVVDVNLIKRDVQKYFSINGLIDVNPHTGRVSVEGSVVLIHNWNRIPVNFEKVTKDFFCSGCDLISLEGSPSYVGGMFDCCNNRLVNLQHAPAYVGGIFSCYQNKLQTLMGADHIDVGGFYCDDNQLRTLEHAPRIVRGSFSCSENKLHSLQGAPDQVANFDCELNPLTTLDHAPSKITGSFKCGYSSHMGLLRACVAEGPIVLYAAPSEVVAILNHHRGQGKAGALKAALKLIRAGYPENARW